MSRKRERGAGARIPWIVRPEAPVQSLLLAISGETALIEYVNAALEAGDAVFVARSLGVVARGVAGLAVEPSADLGTVIQVMHALGVRLRAEGGLSRGL